MCLPDALPRLASNSILPPAPTHHSQHVGAGRQGCRRPGRAHEQHCVLRHQPSSVAPRRRNLLLQLCPLLRLQVGPMGEQELLPAAQRAPLLAGGVMAKRLGRRRRQQLPLVCPVGSNGMIGRAVNRSDGMMRTRRRCRRPQVERAQAAAAATAPTARADAAAAYLSASRCSVRVRRRTEGSPWEAPLRTKNTSAAQTASQSSAGASCVIVLVASEGAQRAWVPYECRVVLGRSCTARSRGLRQAKRRRCCGSEPHGRPPPLDERQRSPG